MPLSHLAEVKLGLLPEAGPEIHQLANSSAMSSMSFCAK